MPRRKKHSSVTPEDTRDWLKKAVHSAPRPLPAGFFPRILEQSVQEGFLREELLNALDEWLNEHAQQSVYDMGNSTDKYIHIRLNVPLWDMERNRSYKLSNFNSDLKKFLRSQLGEDYGVSVTAMGQRLEVRIE